ncbi:MAG: lipopolysaccharide kinase InaA family protein [Kiritimatiellales bacterium]
MRTWYIHPDYREEETGEAFSSLHSVFTLEGDEVSRGVLGTVVRAQIAGGVFYIKRYFFISKRLRRRFVRPRLFGEIENLQRFRSWGIPTADIVAYGCERRWLFLFRRGALVTKEIPDTMDLTELAETDDPRLKNPEWVDAVSKQLAGIARIMHERRFAHEDFKWRNILVTKSGDPKVFLIDCPCGTFWIPPFLTRRKIKDIACLDKVAKKVLSRTQRLRFFMDYAAVTRLNKKNKRTVRRILHFFDGRE